MGDTGKKRPEKSGLRDTLSGQPRVIMEGNRRVTVENHHGVLLFTEDKLKVQTTAGPLCVHGKNLQILWINQDDIIIGGRLSGAYLEDENAP